MREELRTGSTKGIALQGASFGQKAFSVIIACLVTALLIIIPNLI